MTVNQLERVANLLIKAYKREIVRDGDWWFGTDDHDFNIWWDCDKEGYYYIDVYEHDGKETDYSKCTNLPQVYLGKETQ